MYSYVTSIYMHVICNLYVFVYNSYVINMSTVCHSYVLVYYPHAICMSLLYHLHIIRMQLVCNHMLLAYMSLT